MGTEIKYTLKGKRLTCSGRECPSYQKVEGHQIWKCVAPHGFTPIGRKVGSTCHPGERQRLDRLEAENVSLRKDNAQLRRIETRTKVLRERVTSMEAEIKEAKEIAFGAVPGRPESGSMMQNTLLEQIAVLVRGFEARVDRWSVRAGAAELERDRLLAQARKEIVGEGPSGDTYEDAICMVEGHVHGSREAEAICSLRWQLSEARKVRDTLQATCDAYEVRLGREMEHRPEIAEPEVPTLLAELAQAREKLGKLDEDFHFALDDVIRKTGEIDLLKAEVDQQSEDIAKVQGEVLAAVMIGVAEGRVHWNMQVHVAQPVEPPKVDDPARVERVWNALRKYLHGIGVSVVTDDLARAILAAADAPPKANTCAPSCECWVGTVGGSAGDMETLPCAACGRLAREHDRGEVPLAASTEEP